MTWLRTRMRSPNETLVSQASSSGWASAQLKRIDLEGIGTDGFGYTVHIAGPSKAEVKRQALSRLQANLEINGLVKQKKKKTQETTQVQSTWGNMGISAVTEVNVRQSVSSDVFSRTLSPDPDYQHAKGDVTISIDPVGDNALEQQASSPERPKPDNTQSHPPVYSGMGPLRDSVEDLDALPAISPNRYDFEPRVISHKSPLFAKFRSQFRDDGPRG